METIGDCYVGECVRGSPLQNMSLEKSLTNRLWLIAVCGVPKANSHHAVVMSQFAREAMNRFKEIICDLELTLGPDTGGKDS